MRTTIIPAQITTVEDKIAGSLGINQIFLMIIPVLGATFLYTAFRPEMKLTGYKIILILAVTVVCFVLALRIKEKIVLDWLVILGRYQLRAKYYVFDKNTAAGRQIYLPKMISPEKNLIKAKRTNKADRNEPLSVTELVKLDNILNSGKLAVNFNLKDKH